MKKITELIFFAFLFFILLSPNTSLLVVQSNFTLFDIGFFGFFLYYLVSARFTFSYVLSFPLILGVAGLVSSLINNYKFEITFVDFAWSLRWLYYFCIIFAVRAFIADNDKRRYSVVIVCLLSIFYSMLISWFLWAQNPRFLGNVPWLHIRDLSGSIVVSRTGFGFYLVILFSLSLALFFFDSRGMYRKVFFIAIAVLSGLSVYMTFSEGPWIVAMFAAASSIGIWAIDNFNRLKFFGLMFFAICLLMFIYLILGGDDFISSFSGRFFVADIYSGRFGYLTQSLTIMFSNPVFGVGPGNYPTASLQYGYLGTSDPHNVWSWLGAEIGLIGFFGFLFLFLYLFRALLQVASDKKCISKVSIVRICAVVLLAFFGLGFLTGQVASQKVFWVICGVILSLFQPVGRNYCHF